MSRTHLTPGSLSINPGEHNGCRIDGPDGRAVAHTIQRDPHPAFGQGITQAQAEAAAHLFVIAPEILEALQRLSAQCERLRLPGQKMTDAERNALAVLAKATGSEG